MGSFTLNEMIETGAGDQGENRHTRTPSEEYFRSQKGERRAGQRHETVSERLNNFNILSNDLRFPLKRHSSCFRAVVVITQLNIENGQPFFQIKYYDDI